MLSARVWEAKADLATSEAIRACVRRKASVTVEEAETTSESCEGGKFVWCCLRRRLPKRAWRGSRGGPSEEAAEVGRGGGVVVVEVG